MTDDEIRRASENSIRAVLWEWDPIGAKAIGSAWAPGEYDGLVEPLQQALRHSPNVDELARGLHEILTVHYGLPSPHGCVDAAVKLLSLQRSPRIRRDGSPTNAANEKPPAHKREGIPR